MRTATASWATNRDMPYDQFVFQQLAADQMADWKMGEKLSPDAVDKLTATSFLRLTPDGTDNQSIYEIDKQYDALHAVTEVSMKALMGISLGCARCHDHKFDPILRKDYYRIMAAIRPVYDPDDVFPPRNTKWLAANIGSGEPVFITRTARQFPLLPPFPVALSVKTFTVTTILIL